MRLPDDIVSRWELQRSRVLLFLGAFVYPLCGEIFARLIPHSVGSWFGRFCVGGAFLLVLALSYRSDWVRQRLDRILTALLTLLTLHYFWLVWLSQKSLPYQVGAMVIVSFVSSMMTTRRALYLYAALVMVVASSISLSFQGAFHGTTLPAGLATILLISYLTLIKHLHMVEALTESEVGFKDLFNATFEGIILHDGERIIDANESAAKLFGHARDRMVGMKVLELIDPASRTTVSRNISARSTRPYEVIGLRNDRSTFAVEGVGKHHHHHNRDLHLLALRDVSERKEVELQLRHADRLTSLGTLAAGVGHEINNPLFMVTGSLDLALERLRRGEENSKQTHVDFLQLVETARRGAERIRFIVKDLNTLSRRDEISMGPVDIGEVLDSSVSMAHNELRHRARVVREFSHGTFVHGNEARLGQVFINLLINAAHAIGEGDCNRNEIRIRVTPLSGGTVEVSVQDTGCGMTPDVARRVFDPFFTTKPVGVGTGLGLSICHRIIQSLGGQITVESQAGLGTTFRVFLKVAPAAARTEPVPEGSQEKPEHTPLRHHRILIVDDDDEIGVLLARKLREHYFVRVSSSGREALELVESEGPFDIILCDLLMPDFSGMDLYREISRAYPGVEARMIFMTGGAFTTQSSEFLERVPNRCLEKPIRFAELLEFVQRALNPEPADKKSLAA